MIAEYHEAGYETKTVKFHDPDAASLYTVMITAFDADGVDHLDDVGFRGRHMMFTLLAGGEAMAHHDPYKLMRKVEFEDGGFKEFLVRIRSGWQSEGRNGIPWDRLNDGERYNEAWLDNF